MSLPIFGPYNCAAEFLSEFDFTAEFDFELDFTYPPASVTDSTFGDDEVSINFTVEVTPGQCSCRRRWKHCSNRMYPTESVKTLCRYCEFLAPGVVYDLTYLLFAANRYVEFCKWF